MPNYYIVLFDQTKGREVARKLVKNTASADLPKAGYATVANADNARFSVNFGITPAMIDDQFVLVSRYTSSKDGNSDYSDYWFNNKSLTLNDNRAGYLDNFRVAGDQIIASGWHADDAAQILPTHFLILFDRMTNHEVARQQVTNNASADIAANGFGNINNADHSRFSTTFKITLDMADHQFVLVSRYSDSKDVNDYGHYVDYWFLI